MTCDIAIIDYDMGNLRSVAKALEHVGARPIVTRDPEVIRKASKTVLPGVGAFKKCMENLEKYKLTEVVRDAIHSGKPFLGICLGLQLLFDEAEENGPTKGLGIFRGKVPRFHFSDENKILKIPHMGWNQVTYSHSNPLLKDIASGTEFYFVHSYHVVPADASLIAATTSYGYDFCSMIHKDNVFACQFHPEKSQAAGLKLLKNFAEL